MAAGIAMIHQHFMLIEAMSVVENVMLGSPAAGRVRGMFLSVGGLHDNARRLTKEYDIRGQGPKKFAARLSGGNQQKIVVARELDRKPAVLIAHQAAWGLDPGATRFVLERVLALREAGAAILYFSSELEEVLEVADRVAVMANRCFAGVTNREGADIGQIGLGCRGGPHDGHGAARTKLLAGVHLAIAAPFRRRDGGANRSGGRALLCRICASRRAVRPQSVRRFCGHAEWRARITPSDRVRAESHDALSAGRQRRRALLSGGRHQYWRGGTDRARRSWGRPPWPCTSPRHSPSYP